MPSGTAVDSNVLIAAADEDHIHHQESAAFLTSVEAGELSVPAHCHAETYSQLTRGDRPFRWRPERAVAYLENVAANTTLIGMTPAETLDAILAYAGAGGIGPRLYDHLIGQAVVSAGIKRLVTWNTSHMRSLFPRLDVLTPTAAAGAE